MFVLFCAWFVYFAFVLHVMCMSFVKKLDLLLVTHKSELIKLFNLKPNKLTTEQQIKEF